MPHSDPAVDQPPVGSVRLPVAVGPGRPIVGLNRQRTLGDGMTGHPIQSSKVQRPQLREQTLARERLLDWLAARIHDRVILILADAGYGKTTLLADYSRRTRIRTLWYRLDEDDRDWIPFLSHIVASGREHDPGFAPKTAALLGDLAMGGPTREAATDVLIRELSGISEHGAVLILDDFHLVDESPDIRYVVREIVARAPERLSIVFASRRTPSIPLAQLRSSGELAELRTDDLRFDAMETERLFNETYGRALEPDVIADVTARTEGWAASLQLVQAALRDRSPAETRRFIRSLSGADQELYDYLAEEVVGDLDEDLQDFLMRTSLLQVVSPELAAVAAGISPDEVARLTTAAERLTLLSRPPRVGVRLQRYHPLVRGFLEARLQYILTSQAIASLHRKIGHASAGTDWRAAAYHYRQAGEDEAVAQTIAGAIPEIMGSGQHSMAAAEIDRVPVEARLPALDLVASRIQMQRRDYDPAIATTNAFLATVDPGSQESDYALLNLITLYLQAGRGSSALPLARQLGATTSSEQLRLIAEATALMIESTDDGSIDAMSNHLRSMAHRQRDSHPHFFGVTMLNLALTSTIQDDPQAAIGAADDAIDALEQTSSTLELAAALTARSYALTLLGQHDQAQATIERATELDEMEPAYERADLADSYSNPDAAGAALETLSASTDRYARHNFVIQSAWHLGRRGRYEEANALLLESDQSGGVLIGHATARRVVAAYIAVASGAANASGLADEAWRVATHQGATRWRRVAQLLRSYLGSSAEFSSGVHEIGQVAPWDVTHVADLVARRLGDLDDRALETARLAATTHPGRWRFVLRRQIDESNLSSGIHAAQLLEIIGDRSDIQRLREFARLNRKQPGMLSLGRPLARMLADPVFVEDQNRVAVIVGSRHIAGSTLRRKVLALLCFMLTRPEFASTRDQVLDALWPDVDPPDAVNSLNQTVYFLRRVLEENYVDDLSPGYLHHDSDLLWLDQGLLSSRSGLCQALITSMPRSPTPDQVARLVDAYEGRFALDFEYEEWAAPFRDWLHASYLEIVERAVTADIETGHFDRGIGLARRALRVDPTADNIEVSLLRLYRASGAHAAAAEQYSHYASSVREQLGVEPPALESL
jgi:DNA-binding SARP family transcriptional activator/tetratricopeptide (TPR) repeat protein